MWQQFTITWKGERFRQQMASQATSEASHPFINSDTIWSHCSRLSRRWCSVACGQLRTICHLPGCRMGTGYTMNPRTVTTPCWWSFRCLLFNSLIVLHFQNRFSFIKWHAIIQQACTEYPWYTPLSARTHWYKERNATHLNTSNPKERHIRWFKKNS